MAISNTSPFDAQHPFPLDLRVQQQTLNDRDSISEFIRWEGMLVYVIDEAKTYRLTGGLSNSQWEEFGSSGGGAGTYIPMTWVDPDPTLAADSDQKLATQHAVKTYIDTAIGDLPLTLQGVTDNGNVTDNSIVVTGGSGAAITEGVRIRSQTNGHTVEAYQAGERLGGVVFSDGIFRGEVSIRLGTSSLGMNIATEAVTLIGLEPGNTMKLTGGAPAVDPTDFVILSQLNSEIGNYIPLSQKGANNGVVPLDGAGLIPTQYLPPVTITETFVVASQAAMLALDAQTGDVAVRTDISQSFILQQEPASTLSNWVELLNPGAPVQSVNGQTGTVQLDLGLTGGSLTLTGSASVNLDARYYTKTNLQTSGQASVYWGNLIGVPESLVYATYNLPASALTYTANFHDIPLNTYVASVGSGATNKPWGTSGGALFSFGSGIYTGRITIGYGDDRMYYGIGNDPANDTYYQVASREWVNSLAGVAQTLSLSGAPGGITISGGNSINLTTLLGFKYQDFGTPVSGGLLPVYSSSGSTGYPSAIGSGILRKRAHSSDNNTDGSFVIWKNTGNDGKLMFNVGTTGTGWKGFETFASEEHVDANYLKLGSSTTNPAPVAGDVDDYGTGFTYSSSSVATNIPSWATTDGAVLTMKSASNRQLWIGRLGEVGVRGGTSVIPYTDDWIQLARADQYLKLTGGTLTGQLTSTAGEQAIRLAGAGTNNAYIGFYKNDNSTRNGYIGFAATQNHLRLTNENPTTPIHFLLLSSGGANGLAYEYGSGTKTVWHSGNLDLTAIQTDISDLEADVQALNQDIQLIEVQLDDNVLLLSNFGGTQTVEDPVTFSDVLTVAGGPSNYLSFQFNNTIRSSSTGFLDYSTGLTHRFMIGGSTQILGIDINGAVFSKRVKGVEAVDDDEFVTLSQLNAATGVTAGFGISVDGSEVSLGQSSGGIHIVTVPENEAASFAGSTTEEPVFSILNGVGGSHSIYFDSGSVTATNNSATLQIARDGGGVGDPAVAARVWLAGSVAPDNELEILPHRTTTKKDFQITGTGSGILLFSPDNTLYRIKVANGGTITVTPA